MNLERKVLLTKQFLKFVRNNDKHNRTNLEDFYCLMKLSGEEFDFLESHLLNCRDYKTNFIKYQQSSRAQLIAYMDDFIKRSGLPLRPSYKIALISELISMINEIRYAGLCEAVSDIIIYSDTTPMEREFLGWIIDNAKRRFGISVNGFVWDAYAKIPRIEYLESLINELLPGKNEVVF